MIAALMSPTKDTALVGTWREILERHARVSCALTTALENQHGLGMSEFEVLEHLAAIDSDECRMQSLADEVHLSQSALSRVIGRLEKDGLVERKMCSQDRRGIFTALTPEGRERYESARPTHREVLERELA